MTPIEDAFIAFAFHRKPTWPELAEQEDKNLGAPHGGWTRANFTPRFATRTGEASQQILEWLDANGPANTHEIAAGIGLRAQSVGNRLGNMVRSNFVYSVGSVEVGTATKPHKVQVWRIGPNYAKWKEQQ